MRPLDWAVLVLTLFAVVAYGLWKARGTKTTDQYLRAGNTMPWYAMALSIMATQASAITFISTTGQAYVDGMRFVQFYFGLPLAMIVISVTVVPLFHRANVYTAYEYLERRFDAKTRTLVSAIFLIQRGLAVGLALSAPAIVLTVLLGWPDLYTTVVMGGIVVAYTVFGGVQAVTWTDFQQMLIMMAGLAAAFCMAIYLLPDGIGLSGALTVAGAAGKLNPVTTNFSWDDRYNIWSGLFGGMFLALAYFGCDQSQVQRYLTGSSIAQSRMSLLFNAVAKIPMQFSILLTGAMVFAFFTFVQPPLLFQPADLKKLQAKPEYSALQQRYESAFVQRREAANALVGGQGSAAAFSAAQNEMDAVRKAAAKTAGSNDTNYIFLHFVLHYLPQGIVGLVFAAILAAAMSTISGEINSLATVSVIDIYKRMFRPEAADAHYLWASRIFTAFWGVYAVVTAQFAKNLGSLVEAVNLLGSLFYGGILGVFALAIYFPSVGARGAFYGVLFGEAVIFTLHFTGATSFLWYNVAGCAAVIVSGLLISRVSGEAVAR
ncbi:MAG TPA: sodium:solute symporter [Bryobacteraceae bacterium]|nr:sodium:solute symporter [Bryobacteraceae bacterium]